MVFCCFSKPTPNLHDICIDVKSKPLPELAVSSNPGLPCHPESVNTGNEFLLPPFSSAPTLPLCSPPHPATDFEQVRFRLQPGVTTAILRPHSRLLDFSQLAVLLQTITLHQGSWLDKVIGTGEALHHCLQPCLVR